MTICAYGAFRTDTTMSDSTATYVTQDATFIINAYSQITMTEGDDPTIISGDSVTNEAPNNATQTYNGNAIIWDYTIQVSDGEKNYEIGVIDVDLNSSGNFDNPDAEQGYFLMFLDGQVPPWNRTLAVGSVVDNGPSIDVDSVVPGFVFGTSTRTPTGHARLNGCALEMKSSPAIMVRSAFVGLGSVS